MGSEEEERIVTAEECSRHDDLVTEKIDADGNKWRKVYSGSGKHFENWLEQAKELGEVMVEEIDSTGYKCFEAAGEKLYAIWVKIGETEDEDLF
jgi:hypothetical protein